jgi:hypothetical protein
MQEATFLQPTSKLTCKAQKNCWFTFGRAANQGIRKHSTAIRKANKGKTFARNPFAPVAK